VVQDGRIKALELTDPIPGAAGPQGPIGPEGRPGGAPPCVSLSAAQIQTALDLTSGLRWLIADHYRLNGFFAADNLTAGANPAATWSNNFIDISAIINGTIEATFRSTAAPEIANARIFLIPVDPGSAVIWFDCLGDGVTDVYLAELNCAFFDPPHEPTYSLRRQIETSNDLVAQANARQLVQDFYNLNGYWPTNNLQTGLGLPDEYQNRYVPRLEVANIGLITVTFDNNANILIQNETLTWIPMNNGSSIRWDCFSNIPEKYLPLGCRN